MGFTGQDTYMEAFWISTTLVTLAEVGDKTQLLSFLLGARFRKPALIVSAIAAATLLNHALAGIAGKWVTVLLPQPWLHATLGTCFLLMAVWLCIPDRLEGVELEMSEHKLFATVALTFFLAEMGDKTQAATFMLSARYPETHWVVLGTTLGMLVANAPAAWLGQRFAHWLNPRWVQRGAAAVFFCVGIGILLQAGWRL